MGISEIRTSELAALAKQVNSLVGRICESEVLTIKHGKQTKDFAIEAGKILVTAKGLCAHGQWNKWFINNIRGIDFRTAQNYMRLAETKHVSLLNQAESLREAYINLGIIKPPVKPKQDGKTPTPEEVRRDNPSKYARITEQARFRIRQRVISEIEGQRRFINFNMGKWGVEKGKPYSTDKTGALYSFLVHLSHVGAMRVNSGLTHEDETRLWIETILCELLKNVRRETFPVNLETMGFIELARN